jgi:inorganic pyrophosphatase/exopolyphosphatase
VKYIDNVLLKLRRQYEKDEVLSAFIKKISELEVENGKLTSYIQELEDKLHQKSLLNGGEKWFKKYNQQLGIVNILVAKNKKYKEQNKELRNEIKSLKVTN